MKRYSNYVKSTFFIFFLAAFTLSAQEYSKCKSWKEIYESDGFRYVKMTRISDPGTKQNPQFTGFWFYDEQQFDESGRYALGMTVYFQDREVVKNDRGDIGYFDLQHNNKWTKIGETTAWNWQQGCRLQWRPNSEEILWNDRSEDGTQFICKAFNFETGKTRILPRPIYDVTKDGRFALTHDFTRMEHAGTKYVGIQHAYPERYAPPETGIEKMDMETGEVEFITSLATIAENAFPKGYTGKTNLYIFREGWNPSGSRFITFLRNMDSPRHVSAWSVSADGKDIRYFFNNPSHHVWQDDITIFEGRYFSLIKDDESGEISEVIADVDTNVDPTILPPPYNDWILCDTYVIKEYQYMFLYHRPTKTFVPLAKLKSTGKHKTGIFRADLHVRCSRDGKIISFDSNYEGLGRQLYTANISYILDNPPK